MSWECKNGYIIYEIKTSEKGRLKDMIKTDLNALGHKWILAISYCFTEAFAHICAKYPKDLWNSNK
jgi:hypothetical protein